MKILVLAPQPYYQDRREAISLRLFLETLASEGHQVTAMVYPEGENIIIPRCQLLRVPKSLFIRHIEPGFSWKNFLCDSKMLQMAKRLLQREQFDLIHAGTGAFFMARHLSKRYKIPYSLSVDSSLPVVFSKQRPLLSGIKPFLKGYEKRAVRGSCGVLTPSTHYQQIAQQYGGSGSIELLGKTSILPAEMIARPRKDTDLGTRKNTRTLMYVGNLQPHQGIDLLLESFSLAYLDKEKLRLVIIGGTKAEITRYKRKAKNLGVGAAVFFTGPKPAADLSYYLAQADILISPCIEGHTPPTKIFSYLDSNRPLLATRLKMHTEILNDSVARLVEPVDSEMATAMVDLARNEKIREELATKAKLFLNEKYSRALYAQKLRTFLKNLPIPVNG